MDGAYSIIGREDMDQEVWWENLRGKRQLGRIRHRGEDNI
jgi:hypothetical protein